MLRQVLQARLGGAVCAALCSAAPHQLQCLVFVAEADVYGARLQQGYEAGPEAAAQGLAAEQGRKGGGGAREPSSTPHVDRGRQQHPTLGWRRG